MIIQLIFLMKRPRMGICWKVNLLNVFRIFSNLYVGQTVEISSNLKIINNRNIESVKKKYKAIMQNKSNTEDIAEIQKHLVKMRSKYCNKISKYYDQNTNIDLKLLKKRELKPEVTFEIPEEMTLEENLLDSLNNDLVNKERINLLLDKLKNLNKITIQNIKMKNCDIYKQIAADF